VILHGLTVLHVVKQSELLAFFGHAKIRVADGMAKSEVKLTVEKLAGSLFDGLESVACTRFC
jgi:hypothetical protein